MNIRKLDRIRRQSSPLEVDLIEHYMAGSVSRRFFVSRGAMLGLSAPVIGSVLAACGSDDEDDATTGSEGESSTEATTEGTTTVPPTAGGDLTAAIQFGDANSGLDPLNMLDLGTYAVLSQSFEYLVGLGPDRTTPLGGSALSTGWEANEDGSVWTFNLREGVTWHDGSPFTSADVAATIDRMVEVGAGLAGVVAEGAVETPDDLTAVINLEGPNGNFPVLVSPFNPQSLITPVDFASGDTLDARPTGTGAWMLDSFDATTFTSVFTSNPNWWGGAVNLDSVTLTGFEDAGAQVSAMQAREVDMVQQFSVIDGAALLDDENFEVLSPPSANHRQIWFNTQEGQFQDPRVRQAIGLCLDRQEMVDVVYRGRARVANDHPVYDEFPMFDPDATPQRERNIEMAQQLLSDAGVENLEATLQIGNLQDIPDLAGVVERNCAEAGITLTVAATDNSDFYGEHWCPGASWGSQPDTSGPGKPCGSSAEIGIVDYGHRPTPDVYFGRALATDGDWNSSNYTSEDFDRLFNEYQSSPDVDGQRAAVGQIQSLLQEDMPASYPIFFDYLGGHDSSVSGVETTALGHMNFQKASKA